MGGEPRKHEPSSSKHWKENAPIWELLKKGKVTGYLEKLHDFKPHITEEFF